MKIQCPKCNKIIIMSEDCIIPKVGLCPNCGDEVSFNASTDVFPNNQYDKDGNLVFTDEISKENFRKLGSELNNMIKELQDCLKGDK